MSLLDLTARYGAPDATLNGNYAASVAVFLAGQAALIQQGNWIEPDADRADPSLDIGVLPIPVGSRPENRLPMGVPNFWVVNKDSPVRAEAKEWLTWLWRSPTGHRFLLDELKVIAPYRSLENERPGALSAPFAQAWKEGRTLPWAFPRFQDRTKAVAAAMRSYLEHPQTHREFWKSLVRAWRKP
jgi:raffinose/stachyose/melibiose transport system substrate-binding protein